MGLVLLELLIKTHNDEYIFEHFRTNISVDTIVYPIIFSARHQIELFLKQQINNIGKTRKELKVPDPRVIKTHNLDELWLIFKENAIACDKRFLQFLVDVESDILAFAQIDLTGETFRYPYGSDGNKHLIDRSVIGLQNFYNGYKELVNKMHHFEHLSDSLIREYRVGTFTNKLSRNDIEAIAKETPRRSEWYLDSFIAFKEQTKIKYNLGSKELSDVLNIIKNHREFSSLSNDEIKLVGLNAENLINLVHELTKTFPETTVSNEIEFRSPSFGEPEKNLWINMSNLTLSLKKNLTIEEIAIISALNEHGGLDYYSEEFDFLLEIELKEATPNNVIYMAEHIVKSKTIKNIKNALRKLGQTTILESLS